MKNVFYIFISLYCFSVFSQNEKQSKTIDTTSTWQLLKYDARTTGQGIGHAYSRPFHWKTKDLKKLTTIAIGAFALSIADEEVNRLFTNNREDYPQEFRDVGFRFGKPQTFLVINAGLYGFGLFTKNEKIRKTSVLIFSSAITSGILQSFVKTAVGRSRPYSGQGHDSFNPFSSNDLENSFPSGHTVLSVTMAHAVAKQFDNVWVKVGIYSLGAITPITRMVESAHWISDVAVGSILSIVVVDSIDKFLFNKNAYPNTKQPKKISWNLKLSSSQIGIVGVF